MSGTNIAERVSGQPAALLTALLVAVIVAGGCSGTVPPPTPTAPTSAPDPGSEAPSTATPRATPSLPGAAPSVTTGPPILFGGEGVLEAGTYVIRLLPHGFPNVLITVPDGWSTDTDWYVGTPGYISGVLFWNVVDVYAHPCRWKGPLVHPGPTVDDLVAALVAQPLRNATKPVDVTIDGYRGKQLEWSVPDDIDFANCDDRDDAGPPTFESWTATGWASDRYQQSPGQIDRLWILDVAGARLVIDAQFQHGATKQQIAELMQVVESIRFER